MVSALAGQLDALGRRARAVLDQVPDVALNGAGIAAIHRTGRAVALLIRDELAGVVREAVAQLNGRTRAAVELHQFEERSYAEVAAELDMTPKAAKSLLYRARNQLREVLQPFVS